MESGFHFGVLRERPDVNVVLHFQSHYATAVACMKNRPTNLNVTAEIPCHVGSEVPVVPIIVPVRKNWHKGDRRIERPQFGITVKTRTSGMWKRLRRSF